MPLGHVTCTYVNQGHGALAITKKDGKGHAVNGAVFLITGPGGYSHSFTTGAGGVDGVIYVDGLAAGSYTASETSAPTGYAKADPSSQTKSVSANGVSSSDTTFNGTTFTFTDPPLLDIQVNFRDGGSKVTSGTISCDNTTGTTDTTKATGWDTTATVTGIHAPTTVHCTITIDP